MATSASTAGSSASTAHSCAARPADSNSTSLRPDLIFKLSLVAARPAGKVAMTRMREVLLLLATGLALTAGACEKRRDPARTEASSQALRRTLVQMGFTIDRTADGALMFRTARGATLPTVPSTQAVQDAQESLRLWAAERNLEIGPETSLPWWDGAIPDYAWAVSSLLDASGSSIQT
jgi:hypothetical protein